jgi:hypothetical protein
MKKYIFCLCVFCCLTSGIWAQVVITPLPHQEGFFTLDDIWRVNLTNMQQGPVEVQIEATIEDGSHRQVLNAVSPPFLLPKGNIRPSFNGSSVRFQFGNSSSANIFRTSGRASIGNYIICYRVLSLSTNQQLGEYCQEETVKPFGPPELISPYDDEKIETTKPILTWKAPFPLGDQPVVYVLRLVELKPKQNAVEGLERNKPLITRKVDQVTYLSYPGDAPELEVDHTYAWQVVANVGDFEIGATEIWKFKVQPPELLPPIGLFKTYYELKDAPNNGFHPIRFQKMQFLLENRYSSTYLSATTGNQKVIFEIYPEGDRSAQVVMNTPTDVLLMPGNNKIVLNLSGTGFTNDKKYLLLVRDPTGREYFLDFIYENN